LILILAGAISFQYLFDREKKKVAAPQPYLMPASVVKAADLGLNSAAADYVWIDMIQYYGSYLGDGYKKLADYVKLANDLDPKFSYPYAFATLMLPGEGMVDEALQIGERGLVDSDPDWRIPYYMAVTYHVEKGDTAAAAKYFDIAAKTPGAPPNIQIVAASYGSRPDLREQTRLIWQSLYDNSDDEVVREHAKAYLDHFAILNVLEQAAAIYKQQKGNYPANINDLVSSGIMNYIPQDPFGFTYYIDEAGRARVKVGN
jgi:hypothetical protein